MHVHLTPPLPTPLPHAVWAVQCYCNFDPGESGLIKDCTRQHTTCNVTGEDAACFYTRQLRGTTVTVQYGCFQSSSSVSQCPIASTPTAVALHQCCDTDLCNRIFTEILATEMTPTPTSLPTASKEGTEVH